LTKPSQGWKSDARLNRKASERNESRLKSLQEGYGEAMLEPGARKSGIPC
jgi:hypothetical protein